MQVAFKSGSVMAYFVVAFSLLGINICYTWLGRDGKSDGVLIQGTSW